MHVRVMTVDGVPVVDTEIQAVEVEWDVFNIFVRSYIDTEGQLLGAPGFVVQLIDDDDNIVAEETQESYTL